MNTHLIRCLVMGACVDVVLSAMPASAAALLVANPGFEQDLASPGTFPVLVPAGWSLFDPNSIVDQSSDAVGVVNPTGTTFFPSGVPEGNNAALIYLAGDPGGGEVGLSQTLASVLEPDHLYTLTVEVGNIASGFGAPPFNSFFDLDGFPGYRVELRAGGTVLATDNNSLAGALPEGEFRTSTVTATIGASHPDLGQLLTVRLVNLNIAGTPDAPGIEVDFDHVRIDATAVPEPRLILSIGAAGILAFAGWRRWRIGGKIQTSVRE